jgi:hypothetical protein
VGFKIYWKGAVGTVTEKNDYFYPSTTPNIKKKRRDVPIFLLEREHSLLCLSFLILLVLILSLDIEVGLGRL